MLVTVDLNSGLVVRHVSLVHYQRGAVPITRKYGTCETRSMFEEGDEGPSKSQIVEGGWLGVKERR